VKRRKVIGWFVVVFSLLVMFVGGPLMKIFGMPFWPAVTIGLVIMWGGFRLTKGKTLF